jgi:hypothetical protein
LAFVNVKARVTMEKITSKAEIADKINVDGFDPTDFSYEYFPPLIPNIPAEVNSSRCCTFAELPDELESFFCYDQSRNVFYEYNAHRSAKIIRTTIKGRQSI